VTRRARICHLTLSCVEDDPRIRRHGDALFDDGYEVLAIGAPGGRSAPPRWPVRHFGSRQLREGPISRAVSLPKARLGRRAALSVWWASQVNQGLWNQVRDIEADIYIANDWPVLPLAARLADSHAGQYVYDSHEYAVEEHADRRRWRLFFPPYIHGIEAQLVPCAAAVITVSDGIGEAIQRDLGLSSKPSVVRNVPPHREMPYRPPGHDLEILYQGMLAPDRGIVELLESVSLWRAGRHLVIRGPGDEGFIRRLRDIAPTHRVRIDPPGPPQDLVGLANLSDIGIHPVKGTTSQIRYSLPNKFFEYLMAGLSLCVSDLPEMRRLVQEFDVGLTIPSVDPEGIAAAVNSLNGDQVARWKVNSLDAARSFSWANEKGRLLSVVGAVRDRIAR